MWFTPPPPKKKKKKERKNEKGHPGRGAQQIGWQHKHGLVKPSSLGTYGQAIGQVLFSEFAP